MRIVLFPILLVYCIYAGIWCCILYNAYGQSGNEATECFVRARVWLSQQFSLQEAEEIGVDIEHGILKGTRYVESIISQYAVRMLQQRGIQVDILEDDAEYAASVRLQAFQQQYNPKERRAILTNDIPRNFSLGSMGGFFRLEEIYAEFDRMHAMFPELVAAPERIGASIEGRPILAYRICTARAVESYAPEVLYTALHHAREPGSASALVFYAWWLVEQYQSGNPEALYLVNHRQMYIIPVVNPDGYAFNQQRFPTGGGMWRKNRRSNSDGSFGVDLNRNYGTLAFWNAPNNGSSTNPRSDTYRGTEPFSEPETQAIRDFCMKHAFRTAVNYHTFSNLLIYPYSYVDTETPDSLYFRALTAEITKSNLYSAGRDIQTVGYAVRGASDDWMYAGVPGKKIMAYTPEVGTPDDGFWPSPDRIVAQCRENVSTNRMTAWSAGVNLRPVQIYVTEHPQTGFTRVIVEVQNVGVRDASEQSLLSLRPLTPALTIIRPERQIRALRSTEILREAFDCIVDSSLVNGAICPVEVLLVQEKTPRRDTAQIQVFAAQRLILFGDPHDTIRWNTGRWGIVRDAHSGRMVLTDSPRGIYAANTRNYLHLISPIDMHNVRAATLEFQTRWSIESNGDLAVVQVSTDSGATWQTLRTSLMKPSALYGGFGFDGNFPQWIRQECSLNHVLGKRILLRFGLLTDNSAQFDGIYVADIALRLYTDTPARSMARSSLSAPRLLPNSISTGEKLRVEFPLSSFVQANISVYNVLGQVVYYMSDVPVAPDNTATIRFDAVSRGMYVVEIRTEQGITRLPLLVR
ncbi:MAG: M14 family zinc carboxypeptidase [Bacteroidota bacterium]|nr:M14 family zinc carboxypeptidase [Candidatus Kapabacteria bacterium]MDW8219936.1 M14 family zinc carboxypeptidase [Bacteroidota bacterium]